MAIRYFYKAAGTLARSPSRPAMRSPPARKSRPRAGAIRSHNKKVGKRADSSIRRVTATQSRASAFTSQNLRLCSFKSSLSLPRSRTRKERPLNTASLSSQTRTARHALADVGLRSRLRHRYTRHRFDASRALFREQERRGRCYRSPRQNRLARPKEAKPPSAPPKPNPTTRIRKTLRHLSGWRSFASSMVCLNWDRGEGLFVFRQCESAPLAVGASRA